MFTYDSKLNIYYNNEAIARFVNRHGQLVPKHLYVAYDFKIIENSIYQTILADLAPLVPHAATYHRSGDFVNLSFDYTYHDKTVILSEGEIIVKHFHEATYIPYCNHKGSDQICRMLYL